MLKKLFFPLFSCFVALGLFSFTIYYPKAVKTIIIDPGHGGADQGADGLFSTEAQVTLAISKKLGDRIAAEIPGVKVLFTRTTDIITG